MTALFNVTTHIIANYLIFETFASNFNKDKHCY